MRALLLKDEEELARCREEFKERKAEAVQADKDAERSGNECKESYLSMPEDYGTRIAADLPTDWLSTTYPTTADLDVLHGQVRDLDGLRRRTKDAQETLSKWEILNGQIAGIRALRDQLKADLPKSDPVVLRSQQTSLQADETSLANNLKALRKNLLENETEIDRLNKEMTRIQQQIADCINGLGREEEKRKHAVASIERARRALPEKWRTLCDGAGMGEQHQWKMEQEELSAKGTELRYQQLASARIGLEGLQREIAGAEAESSRFPVESRCSPDEVQVLLSESRLRVKQCDQALETARKQKGVLEHHRDLRKEIDDRLLSLRARVQLFHAPGPIAGSRSFAAAPRSRSRAQIVDYANGVLDRLSGGQLFLRLCPGKEGAGTNSPSNSKHTIAPPATAPSMLLS